jgi:hypothetical protein
MAGTAIKVTALISVAMKARQAAHQGIFRPPRKKSRVDFYSRPKYRPTKMTSNSSAKTMA